MGVINAGVECAFLGERLHALGGGLWKKGYGRRKVWTLEGASVFLIPVVDIDGRVENGVCERDKGLTILELSSAPSVSRIV